jgi:hypothetical protein
VLLLLLRPMLDIRLHAAVDVLAYIILVVIPPKAEV